MSRKTGFGGYLPRKSSTRGPAVDSALDVPTPIDGIGLILGLCRAGPCTKQHSENWRSPCPLAWRRTPTRGRIVRA